MHFSIFIIKQKIWNMNKLLTNSFIPSNKYLLLFSKIQNDVTFLNIYCDLFLKCHQIFYVITWVLILES
jgi:hypothetical protein